MPDSESRDERQRVLFEDVVAPIFAEAAKVAASCGMSAVVVIGYTEERVGSLVSLPEDPEVPIPIALRELGELFAGDESTRVSVESVDGRMP